MRRFTLLVLIMLGASMLPISLADAESNVEVSKELRQFNIESGKLIKVKSEVMNNTTGTLTLAYIVQIKNLEGATVQLSWIDGIKVEPREKIQAMQSWIPEETGEYLVEIFVWESITDPDPMSPVRKAIAVVE